MSATATESASATRDMPALVAALVTVTFWASAFVGIRSAGRTFSPGALTFGRMAVAVVVLSLLLAVRRESPPSLAQLRLAWKPVLACSLLWFVAYNLALNAGERRVDAGTASMLTNVAPVIIAILAGFYLGEGFPGALFLGCAVAFAGVALIAVATSTGSSTTVGVLLCLTAAVTYAVALIAQKGILRVLSPLQTTFCCGVIAVIVTLPFAPSLVRQADGAGTHPILWLVYLGTFPTSIAFTTWAFALGRGSAGRLGSTTYLVPSLSILLGWLLLGETPVGLAFAGGAVCLVGVAIARR